MIKTKELNVMNITSIEFIHFLHKEIQGTNKMKTVAKTQEEIMLLFY